MLRGELRLGEGGGVGAPPFFWAVSWGECRQPNL